MLLQDKYNTEAQVSYLIDFFEKNQIEQSKIILLGLDIGAKTIGVATWYYDIRVAIPHSTVRRVNIETDLKVIHDVAVAQKAIILVVGIHNLEQGHDVKFAVAWNDKWPEIPIVYADERFTTSLAHTLMRGVGISRKKRHEVDNEVAASILLNDFAERLVNTIIARK